MGNSRRDLGKTVIVFLVLAGLSLAGKSQACTRSDHAAIFDAYLLVDELRQTSDSLTQMARLYAVTGEDRYKAYFQRILDIRNGAVARPANPNMAYWDATVATGEMPPTDGVISPLHDLLKNAGLSSGQLDLVTKAEDRSNSLAVLELNSFEENPDEARNILNSAEYHHLKAEIMRPINTLLESLLERHRGCQ